MTVRGEFLERNLIVSGIELGLFKNEEEDFDIFEVILTTPHRRFELSQHYNDEKFARQEYQKILEELKGALRRS
jgi:hypothetical protein